MRSNFKARSSLPNLRNWLSSSRSAREEEQRRQADKKESVFCESLLGLMERTGRYGYLDYSKDDEKKTSYRSEEEPTQNSKKKEGKFARFKRVSWSR